MIGCLLIGTYFTTCQHAKPVQSTRQSIAIDKTDMNVKIPYKYIKTTDTLLVFHQDTLYIQTQKFSGYIYRLSTCQDSLFLGSYWEGLEEGTHKKWYPNNQIEESRNYSHGKKSGKHDGFWEDGKPKFTYHFLEGELEGESNEWYQNGKLYKVMNYKKGYEEGSQKMWWENGATRANYVVKKGRRYGLIGLKLCMTPKDSIEKNR